MLVTTHLAATVILTEALSLNGAEAFTAFAGGVLIDLDHVFVNTKWISDIKNFFVSGISTHGEVRQHSWIQEPVFGLFLGIAVGFSLSVIFSNINWWVFPLSQGIHIAMDALMKYEHRPLAPFGSWQYNGFLFSGSTTEFLISILALGVIAFY